MKDLEIRGAGNLLGKTQHGHMEAVGFDMYTGMLNEEVAKLKGIEIPKYFETEIDLDIDAFLPDGYINRESQKLEFYKRIAAITGQDDMDDIAKELKDRFGDIPEPAQNLLKIALIKSRAHENDIVKVKGTRRGTDMDMRLEYRSGDVKKFAMSVEDDLLEKLLLIIGKCA